MPNDVYNGIVLRVTDYRESDRILNILSRERGLIAVTARGGRKPNSKHAAFATQFEPASEIVKSNPVPAQMGGILGNVSDKAYYSGVVFPKEGLPV